LSKKLFAASASRVGRVEKLQRIPGGIDRSREGEAHLSDLEGGFVHLPRVIVGVEMGSTVLLQFGRGPLHPAEDRRMIDLQPSFEDHLFEIVGAERRAQVPTDTTSE
jgi:hypothetical protein